MTTKVVVTGGAGFIGSHLTQALSARGHEVTVVDTLCATGKRHFAGADQWIKEDIRNEEVMTVAFSGADCVFHLAALPRVQRSIEDPFGTGSVNMEGTYSVLWAARRAAVRRVVFASSSSVYGIQPRLPLHEDMRPNPQSPYAWHKWVGEIMCRGMEPDPETVCLRYFNVYGEGFDPFGPYALVIGKLLTQKKNGQLLTITGDGTQTRDFTHVSDVVRATVAAMTCPVVMPFWARRGQGIAYNAVNVGAGNPVSVNRLAELIGGPVEHIAPRLGEPRHTHAAIGKAEQWLGWRPTISIEDGITMLKHSLGME